MTRPLPAPLSSPLPLPSRRTFLRAALALPAGAMMAACIAPTAAPSPEAQTTPPSAPPSAPESLPSTVILEPTLSCADDDDEPTLAQTEGPYYTPNTPERVSFLEEGITGVELLLSGYVLKTDCAPVSRALVDFWHCDDAGNYDNVGYRLRGHQFTDEQGRYQLTTIVPGLYPGRTRHIHVKVQEPNQPVLTTQLYFSDEASNNRDGIFHPSLLVESSMETIDGKNLMDALFNFVLA
jgi:protocatechuate 3,4-dioxygenase beta subunit